MICPVDGISTNAQSRAKLKKFQAKILFLWTVFSSAKGASYDFAVQPVKGGELWMGPGLSMIERSSDTEDLPAPQ